MSKKLSDHRTLIIIDPQHDFCDPKGALYVPGADEDMVRLASHIREDISRYTDIIVSLDSHDAAAIFHPLYWVDKRGEHPSPLTLITRDDYTNGVWRPASADNDIFTKRTFNLMARRNEFGVMVWPEHCLVSTWGWQICTPIMEALDEWRRKSGTAVRYIFKGESPYTEQYSIFDSLDDSWRDEHMREDLYTRLSLSSSVTFAGEAISHCVESSITSYVFHVRSGRSLSEQNIELLIDCTSAVAGFDRSQSERRIAELGVVMKRSR